MAIHKPPLNSLALQIRSITAQRGVSVTCFAVLDGAETAETPGVVQLVEEAGFRAIVNPSPLGVRGAFTRGLQAALAADLPHGTLFSFADQDDVWSPVKLAHSAAMLAERDAALVHCDARVIGPGGTEIAPSLHRFERRSEAPTFFGAMLLNAVTGMTAVFSRRTAEAAARVLARYSGPLLHDHVTAIAAAALGPVLRLDQALVDYRQHEHNHLGARPLRAVLRKRGIGVEPFGHYRQTSVAIFRVRRALAECLDAECLLTERLRTMFLLGAERRAADVLAAYTYECGRLFFRGEMRRWELSLRMADTALFMKRQALDEA